MADKAGHGGGAYMLVALNAAWNGAEVSFATDLDGGRFPELKSLVEKSEGPAWWRMLDWKCLYEDRGGRQMAMPFRIDAEPDFAKIGRLMKFMRGSGIPPEALLAYCQWKGTWDASALAGGAVMSLDDFADKCGGMDNARRILESGAVAMPDGSVLGVACLTSDGANILQDDGGGRLIVPPSLDPSVPENFVIGSFSCGYPGIKAEGSGQAPVLTINIFMGGGA